MGEARAGATEVAAVMVAAAVMVVARAAVGRRDRN